MPRAIEFLECMVSPKDHGESGKVRRNTLIGGVAGSMAGFVIAGPVGLITWGLGTAITTRALACGDNVKLFEDVI